MARLKACPDKNRSWHTNSKAVPRRTDSRENESNRLRRNGRWRKMAAIPMKLKERKEIANGTMAFFLEKPAGFEFKPGQAMEVKLENPPETDAEGNSRAFSIASAPHEPYVMFATRMRDSAMKNSLKKIPRGTEIEVDGPWGDLKLHTRATRAGVFLAGGNGITPFRSIVLDAAKNKLPQRLWLFYSNRRPEDAAFLDDLGRAEKENSNFKMIATMTEMEKSSRPWRGKTGFVDKKMLTEAIRDLNAPIYYIAGPGAMLNAMKKMLLEAGVNEDDIRAEEFAGY